MAGAGRLKPIRPAVAALALLGGSAAAPVDDRRCSAERLRGTAGFEIVGIEALPAGPFAAPDGSLTPIPATCRVRGIARPTPRSRIGFEVWLPATGWTRRYYQLGNGGFAGNIHLPALAAEAARGNASAATDTGHRGDRFDASWAAGEPDRVVDYGHRSIKATADAARALIAAYYDRPVMRRYFIGCSNGGRQALMAAARYPADWDGVVAGAPANPWTRQLTGFADLQHRLRMSPAHWLPVSKLATVQQAALASCPDGGRTADGVALDPRRCRFDPTVLQCRGVETERCLTAPQVTSVRAVQRAGYEPTAANGPDGWAEWIVQTDPTKPSQLTLATQAMRHLAGRSGWTVARFDPRADARALAPVAPILDVRPGDLARFRARGGKIISYFGWADPVISPRLGTRFYREAAAGVGGAGDAQGYYRLFMVPGMAHCQGGIGPTAFGQSIPAPAARDDARHDIRRALEAWVEQGRPPEIITAVTPGGHATRDLRPFSP